MGTHLFVSYSRKNRDYVERLEGVLTKAGLEVWFDSQLTPGGSWTEELEEKIETARAVVLVVTPDSVKSSFVKRELHCAIKCSKVVIPLLREKCDLPFLVKEVQGIDGQADEIPVDAIKGALEAHGLLRDILEERERSVVERLEETPKVSVAHFPPRPPKSFVGREEELKCLDEAWRDRVIGVISVVAFGGAGKSSLVAQWLQRMQGHSWRGAQRVFAYSFHSQGTRPDGPPAARDFFEQALEFFGDNGSNEGPPETKGGLLAQYVRSSRTLLVLDGLEAMLCAQRASEAGQIRDQSLHTLILELAASNPGLCIITTRIPVASIRDCSTIDLRKLTDEEGADLLRSLKVFGPAQKLEQVSRIVEGHAFLLTHLGNYVRRVFDGDIQDLTDAELRDLAKVELFKADKWQGGPARKLMEKYLQWFLPTQPWYLRFHRWLRQHLNWRSEYTEGERMVAILYLLGLFDRPADIDALSTLRAAPSIFRLTEPLRYLDNQEWQLAVSMLCDWGLVTKKRSGVFLDAHPLVREYFAVRLATDRPKEYRKAHEILCRHYVSKYEETLSGRLNQADFDWKQMLDYAAIHGTKAGIWQSVMVSLKTKVPEMAVGR